MSRRESMVQTAALGVSVAAGASILNKAQAAEPKQGGHLRVGMGHGSTTDSLDPAT